MKTVGLFLKGLREMFGPPGPVAETPLRVLNLTRGTVLATSLEVAGSGKSRRKGLLGRAGLSPGEGLWIVPCESVHTFFMRFPIDLVFAARDGRVVKLRRDVRPWRISGAWGAFAVIELAAGAAARADLRPGDRLAVR